MSIDRGLIRQQALASAREQNGILIYIPESLRISAKDLAAKRYVRLPLEFRETFKMLDAMAAEGLFTRTPRDDIGVQYDITAKGRAAE